MWKDFELKSDRVYLASDSLGHDPGYQRLGRSHMSLTDRLELNLGMGRVGDLQSHSGPGTGDHVEADRRLAWRLADNVELYVAGCNLFHRSHAESDDPQRAQRPRRSVYAGTRLRS